MSCCDKCLQIWSSNSRVLIINIQGWAVALCVTLRQVSIAASRVATPGIVPVLGSLDRVDVFRFNPKLEAPGCTHEYWVTLLKVMLIVV